MAKKPTTKATTELSECIAWVEDETHQAATATEKISGQRKEAEEAISANRLGLRGAGGAEGSDHLPGRAAAQKGRG